MDKGGIYSQLTIYIGESDRWEGQNLATAIVELLHKERLAGATVFRGTMGFGANSLVHTVGILTLSSDLPVVITVIDRPERISAILPRLERMVQEGLIVRQEVQVVKYTAISTPKQQPSTPVTPPSSIPLSSTISLTAPVRTIMTPDPVTVRVDTPIGELVSLFATHHFRSLPVVDEEQRVLGLVLEEDLVVKLQEFTLDRVQRLVLKLPLIHHLLGGLREQIEKAKAQTAGELMMLNPLTVEEETPISEVVGYLVAPKIKRVLVVREGKLVGVVSRIDLLRRVVQEGNNSGNTPRSSEE